MNNIALLVAGFTLVSVVGVQSGGLFLLSLLKKKNNYSATQIALFRAGHAHAGVLIILGLVMLILVEQGDTGWWGRGAAMGALAGGPILIPAGFFLSPLGANRDKPGPLLKLSYIGAAILAVSLIVAGVTLIQAGFA